VGRKVVVRGRVAVEKARGHRGAVTEGFVCTRLKVQLIIFCDDFCTAPIRCSNN